MTSFLKAEVHPEPFPVAQAGRRFPQLDARLSELCAAVTKLGVSGDPYSRAFPGYEVPSDNSKAEELEPYRNLDSSRIVLSGTGHWDCTPLLEDSLVLPFRDPDYLLIDRVPEIWEYPKMSDSVHEIAALAKKWDQQNLLVLHAEKVPIYQMVRVFNCYKNSQKDRQIGDRRGRNACEFALQGPSKRLPTGPDFSQIFINPKTHRLAISVSDRKDYYHQLSASYRRAVSNTLGPAVPCDLISDTKAFGIFLLSSAKKKYNRYEVGDLLGMHEVVRKKVPEEVHVSFRSILQGDHAGVEFATSAHEGLLKISGCLPEETRMTSHLPVQTTSKVEGLVIDDYYAVSVEPLSKAPLESWSWSRMQSASRAYDSAHILGSPEKDVKAQSSGKVIGAFLNSTERALAQGLVTASAPVEKRLALSWISMQIAQLRWTTDSLHLCLLGGWVSCLLYRRPLMAIVQDAFSLVDQNAVNPDKPKLLQLPRKVADELVLLAVFAPMMASDLSATPHPFLFATDSSKDKGAIVATKLPADDMLLLHRACQSKGSYTRLSTRYSELQKFQGFETHEDVDIPSSKHPKIDRPMAYRFDFLEIFAGSARVTSFMDALGVVCGPPIDLSCSPEHDMQSPLLMNWLSHLIVEKLIKAFMIEPPCTTFSIMRRPALRSKEKPFGFNPSDVQTKTGNVLAHRGLQSLDLADRHGVVGLLETPFSSKLRYLPSWDSVLSLPSASFCRCDSCRFGSPHLKSFRFLGVHIDLSPVSLRCTCSGKHVVIQGSLTKKSAIYTEGLAKELARTFVLAIASRCGPFPEDDQPASGYENLLVNSLARSSDWSLVSSWTFRNQVHINLQELAAVLRLLYIVAREKTPYRIVVFVDSLVTRGALAKGRSTSRALNSLLKKVSATSIACSLFVVSPFCPTRLNVADDPTRCQPIRVPSVPLLSAAWAPQDRFRLATHSRLKRWASNWAHLLLRLVGSSCLYLRDRSCYPVPRVCSWFPRLRSGLPMDFDATLGFPGEGPSIRPSSSPHRSSPGWVTLWLFVTCLCVVTVPSVAMPLRPRSSADSSRAVRRAQVPLVEGRKVLPQTSSLRESLLAAFIQWTLDEGLDWETMMASSYAFIEEINATLAAYGRALYAAGRPYLHFAETVNAVAASRPSLKRQLQGAWSLAFGWLQTEPGSHHTSMPPQVLLAFLNVALIWGWPYVAGCIALAWGALLRAGEVITATRRQLLLPQDVQFTIPHILLTIVEPKTRFSAAKHQCAKLDAGDLVQLVQLVFGRLQRHQRLWPFSGQTLRTRFRCILDALHLPKEKSDTHRALDLGSLRAGGATWLLNVTENAELTRRRGRWINNRTMEIYIQEVSSVTYLNDLDPATRSLILFHASVFPSTLSRISQMIEANIPPETWYLLLGPAGRDSRS